MKETNVNNYFEWNNKIRIKKIKKFIRMVNKFNEEHNLSNFRDFLYFGYNGISSKTYKFLYIAPVEYLVNSSCFIEFYNNLDVDFKEDIMTRREIEKVFDTLKINQEMKNFLKDNMKEDSRL